MKAAMLYVVFVSTCLQVKGDVDQMPLASSRRIERKLGESDQCDSVYGFGLI